MTQKSLKKIWFFKNLAISLHPLSPLKRRQVKPKVLEKIFLRNSPKNLVISKIVLTFAPLSALKKSLAKVR